MTRRSRGAAGFTLVELLIVTVLLGVLAVVALPSLDKVRQKAMIAASRTDVRQAINAFEAYQAINMTAPGSIEDLQQVGYNPSAEMKVCNFIVFKIQGENNLYIRLQHEGAKQATFALYPLWGLIMYETNAGC